MIKAENLVKSYQAGSAGVKALNGVNLEVGKGKFLTIMGPSGSGKSTLLHVLGGIDCPGSGRI